jgi:hypothetical protein
MPTGTVSWTHTLSGGSSITSSCTLTPAGPSNQASCSVTYTAPNSAGGTDNITGTYNGDSTHNTSFQTVGITIT